MQFRTIITIVFILIMFRLNSQTGSSDVFEPEMKTVGVSTFQICREMKPNCKPGKLVTNERTGIADTTVVYIDGYVIDITGKKLQSSFYTFINQNTKDKWLSCTDSTGRLKISGIESGTYTLKVKCFGYNYLIITDLKFGRGDIRNIIVDVGEYCCTKKEVQLKDHDKK